MNNRSKQLRLKMIDMMLANGGYHYGGSFSCVEILITLFDHVLTNADIFILSKGHSCWGYYALLQEKGYSPKLESHPTRDPNNGVTWTTGSLGHGLPAGVGIALAKKIKKEDGRVFVLMGDGELQEGTLWESLLQASKHKLDNLSVIVDWNGFQGGGALVDILPVRNFADICTQLGWQAYHLYDGHNEEILNIHLAKETIAPTMLIAHTIKGKGVSFMQNQYGWHAKWPNADELKQMREELS